MINSIDVLFCSLPTLFINRLPSAPAILKATAKEAGYSSAGIDLSIEFFINQANRNFESFNQLSSAFSPYEIPNEEAIVAANKWIADSIELIKKYNPKIVGLSVFTEFQHRATVMLASAIRKEMPHIKIILGGYGLLINGNGLQLGGKVKKIDLLKPFWQFAKDKQLADEVFTGTALDDLVDYLNRTLTTTSLDTVDLKQKYKKEKAVLYNTPVPDYDDYKLSEYVWENGPSLPITGSRGCVRNCTFCDVPTQFGKFTFRSGEDIANELIALKEKYNINRFEFTDSLVNGSLKSFQGWLKIVADYNDAQPDNKKIKWHGQYICRPQTEISPVIYDLIVRSGALNLTIGVESGSNEVLKAMNKKMAVEDVLNEVEQFKNYGIQCHILMFSGFYNETWERFVETLEFTVKLQPYVAAGAITYISMGPPLFINQRMPLYHMADELGIIIDHMNNHNWTMKDDPDNNYTERMYRRLIAQLVVNKLGLPVVGNTVLNFIQAKSYLTNIKEELLNG